jgi:CheY-like chemotaxis protein
VKQDAKPQRTILVVDDDRDIVETLCDILEMRGWKTLRAHDGEEAVRVATHTAVDWVLMDVRMPRLSGVEALQAIRVQSPETRAVLMTAFLSPDLATRAQALGATRVLSKPFDPSALFTMID